MISELLITVERKTRTKTDIESSSFLFIGLMIMSVGRVYVSELLLLTTEHLSDDI
jgi:hypothetical protein